MILDSGGGTMRICELEREPFHLIEHAEVDLARRVQPVSLPVVRGVVEGLPEALDALLVVSDLQGMARGENAEGGLGTVKAGAASLGDLVAVEMRRSLRAVVSLATQNAPRSVVL